MQEQTKELTEAEKDLGPCLCCGSPELGRWQVVWEHEDVIGALCFDCYLLANADHVRLAQMIVFQLLYDFNFSPTPRPATLDSETPK